MPDRPNVHFEAVFPDELRQHLNKITLPITALTSKDVTWKYSIKAPGKPVVTLYLGKVPITKARTPDEALRLNIETLNHEIQGLLPPEM